MNRRMIAVVVGLIGWAAVMVALAVTSINRIDHFKQPHHTPHPIRVAESTGISLPSRLMHAMSRPCPTEDSTNCYWNAQQQGNGVGQSWVAFTINASRTRPFDMTCVLYVTRANAIKYDDCYRD